MSNIGNAYDQYFYETAAEIGARWVICTKASMQKMKGNRFPKLANKLKICCGWRPRIQDKRRRRKGECAVNKADTGYLSRSPF